MARIESIERLTELIPDPSAIAAAKVLDHLDDQAIAYIERSPFLIMATENETGLDLSPKGDDPGFVHVLGDKTLLVPERNGNQLKMGLRNILANGRIGLMFFRPATGDVLRVVGRAQLFDDADLCERLTSHGKPAILAIRVEIDKAFFHCPRAILRVAIVEAGKLGRARAGQDGQDLCKALTRPEIEEYIDTVGDERNEELWI